MTSPTLAYIQRRHLKESILSHVTSCLSSTTRERDHYDSGGLIVWDGRILNGHTNYFVFGRGAVIAVRVLLLGKRRDLAVPPDFIFMNDNAST
ncbi:hypothetical protein AVEN_178820-1 [Araneus ventricosus]|uniref:Uncharacterized protein n=1 Tax=Araneus ventricosus TaxID=182803 RepID=A0A4Y2BFQ9_ARAVE|nr:hypothetical protein AVEN_178820-1 [Araneus ventricosus]